MTAMNQIKLGHHKSAKDPVAEKPAALGAFLSTTARNTIKKPKQDNKEEEITALNNDSILPLDVSHKIACMLKPGPPFYSTISSADLIEHLSTSAIMNGETKFSHDEKKWYKPFANAGKNKADESSSKEQALEKLGSVWSNLDSLPSGANAFEINKTDPSIVPEKDEEKDDGLWSAIMFSCDLEGENVELAKSCVVPTNILKEHHFYRGNPQVLFSEIGAGEKYPWDDWSKKEEAQDAAATSAVTRFIAPTLDMWSWPSWMSWGKKEGGEQETPETSKPKEPSNEGVKRVWVPSKDKVSVHARWWGFTVYVPEPAMAELGKESKKAEDIANIVYKILSGILKFSASEPLPTSLGHALKILHSLAPTVSYLSTFIGWSWKELKSCDKGQGIELSATWILPIALIPSQWSAPLAPAAADKDGNKNEQPSEGPVNDQPASDEGKKEEEQGEHKKPDGKKADQENKPEEKKPEDKEAGEKKADEKKADEEKKAEDKKADERKPEDKQPEDKQAEENKPEDKKPEDKKAEVKKPEEKKPEDKKPEDKRAEEKKPAEKKVDEKKAEDKKADEKKPEDKKVEENKPEDKKTEEKKPDEKKAEDKKADEKKPEEKKPEDKKAEEKKHEDKKAEEKKPAEREGNEKKREEKKREEKKPEEKKRDEQPAAADQSKTKSTEQAKGSGNTLEEVKASDKKPEQAILQEKKLEQTKSDKKPEQTKTEEKKPEQAKNEVKKPEQAKTEKKPEQASSNQKKVTEATSTNIKTNSQEQPSEPKQIAQQQKPEQTKREDLKKVESQAKTRDSSDKENKVAEGSRSSAWEPKTSSVANAKSSANMPEEKPTKGGMVRRMLSTKANKH